VAVTALDPIALLILGVVLSICGLALAFFGKTALNRATSILGGIIGGSAGYIIGGSVSTEPYLAAVLGLIGAILGSVMLSYAPNATLAFFVGFIAAVIAFLAQPAPVNADPVMLARAQDGRVMVALLVMVVAFAIVYYFVDELMKILTALIGGVLVAAGVFLILNDPTGDPGQRQLYAAVALGAVFLLGTVVQYALARRSPRKPRTMPA